MNASCAVCGKSFPFERGSTKVACPYCYTDFLVRKDGRLVAAVDDEGNPVATAAAPPRAGAKKKPPAKGAAKPASTPPTLGFADEVATKANKKKRAPRGSSGSDFRSSTAGSGRSAARKGAGSRGRSGGTPTSRDSSGPRDSSGARGKARSGAGGKANGKASGGTKRGRTFEDEVAALAADEPDTQRGYARVVILATVVLLLAGGGAAYVILGDYFARRGDNPLLNEGAQGADATDPSERGATDDGETTSQRDSAARQSAQELINALEDQMAQPTVAGMIVVIHQAEYALAEPELDSRLRGQLVGLQRRAELALEALLLMSPAHIHLERFDRADGTAQQAFELYWAQQAATLAQRDFRRDRVLQPTHELIRDWQNEWNERNHILREANTDD